MYWDDHSVVVVSRVYAIRHVCVTTPKETQKPTVTNRHSTMSTRGRSGSPQSREMDVDMDKPTSDSKPEPKVVVITNLTRNVVEAHLRVIFGFYGEVVKIDLPMYAKCAHDSRQSFLRLSF